MICSRLVDPRSYTPALWDLRTDAPARAHWVRVFRLQFDDMLRILAERRGREHREAALPVREKIFAFLDRLDEVDLADRPHVHAWTVLRDELLHEHGVDDPYREVKEEENERALRLFPEVIAAVRAEPSLGGRLRETVGGMFAGNIFDLGSPNTAREHQTRGVRFAELKREVLARPWLIDHVPALEAFLRERPRGRIVVLVDNAGPDFLCGTFPFGLLLAEEGHDVVFAANERPTLNDVTAEEARGLLVRLAELDRSAREHLAGGSLRLVSTGTRTPGIDLRDVSEEFEEAAAGAEFLVLEGQGRALETNWHARFDLPALRVSTIKDELVATILGGKVYDLICDFREAGAGPPPAGPAARG